ncbi:hypothetical protein BUALT_Bualt05G0092100 [Buddleja alternifolia]|uniref:Uncharacterized protein n=1 Tax=Buddleja alternifolia TaxID=168488 RepID=A0AAV6XR86_9LAMI|nr:hypothetical protein BUALT_Bualt05G0092100 [Buddleja alternifolia]
MNPIENPMKSCSNEEDDWSQYAMQLVNISVLPMVLKACMELDVLEIIRQNTQISPSQIASQLPCHNPDSAALMLDKMLSLLASYSILICSANQAERFYSLAPVSKYFLRNANGVSLAPLLLANQDKIMIDMWYHMKDAVIEGGLPFNRAYGMDASEYIVKNPSYLQLFKASMSSYNSMFMEKILETYRGFEGLESIVDVGGGDGSILKTIVDKYPSIKGINFDIAPVIAKNDSYPDFMKQWMLHSWGDDHCVRILKNCYEALPEHGKVIVVELVVPEAPESTVDVTSKLQFDLFMMNMNPQGKERTETEFNTLARATGFSYGLRSWDNHNPRCRVTWYPPFPDSYDRL